MLCVRRAFLGMLAEHSVGRRTMKSAEPGSIHLMGKDEVLLGLEWSALGSFSNLMSIFFLLLYYSSFSLSLFVYDPRTL
jgi:hypothetical protein